MEAKTNDIICPFEITRHCAERWMERNGFKTAIKARNKWNKAWEKIQEVEVHDKWKVIDMINHNLKEARFFKGGEWVFVVVDEKVVTVYPDNGKRVKGIKK